MAMFDFLALHDQYPAIISQMPNVFDSHEFILELARQNQMLYVEALYAYRDSLFEGTPAPFMFVHRILSTMLNDFPTLVEHKRADKPSKDIFGKSNECAEWHKIK